MALTPEQQRKLEANLSAHRAFVQPGYGGNPGMGQRFASVSPAEAFRQQFPGLGFFPSQEAAAMEQLAFSQGMSPFGKFMASLPLTGTQFLSSIPQLPADMFNRVLLPPGAFAASNAPRDNAFAAARSAKPINAPEITVTANREPGVADGAPVDPMAAFMQGGGSPGVAQSVTTTSGSPLAMGMALEAAAFARQAGRDQHREFSVDAPPIPEAPKFQKTDYSGMDAAIAMLKPEDFAEDEEKKKLALPYLMAGISQGGMSAGEDAGLGTILFKMGMGALSSKALVDEEVNNRRREYEGRMREYAEALARGETEKARVAAEEANRDILMAYEREVSLADMQAPKVGADGSLIQQKIGPDGKRTISVFTPADAARTAGLLGQLSGVVLGATPRTSVTTQTGGRGGGEMPEFVKDEYARRLRISMSEPPGRILASDVVKYGLYSSLGLDDEALDALSDVAMQDAQRAVGMQATPAALTEAFQNARLNRLSELMDKNNSLRVIGALKAQGLNPGASFVGQK